jgi:endonuclease III
MDKLCANYGPLIGHIDGVPFYDMPSPSALTNPRVEEHLRELGFGYRAKYLYQTALMVTREKKGWLDSLRNPESPLLGEKASSAGDMLPGGREGYREAHEKLLSLQGVGPKVADCVCLMGLGWGEAVPVDTHVWQIAQRDYGFGKGRHRSLTKQTYDAIGDHFRRLWGKEAGWAHSVLFTADLKAFATKASETVIKTEQRLNEDSGELLVETKIKIELHSSTSSPQVKLEQLSPVKNNQSPRIKHENSQRMRPPHVIIKREIERLELESIAANESSMKEESIEEIDHKAEPSPSKRSSPGDDEEEKPRKKRNTTKLSSHTKKPQKESSMGNEGSLVKKEHTLTVTRRTSSRIKAER